MKTSAVGFTQVSAEHLTDASGNVVVDGTIYFQPVTDDGGGPLNGFSIGGFAVATYQPVKAQVTNGAFSIPLADTALTTPAIAYQVIVIDNQTGNELLGPGYLIQPTGATWDFDAFTPST